MLNIRENIDLRSKTTLRIGGNARYYAELGSKEDCEEAVQFAKEKSIPLIMLGGGSNTIFADGVIEALVVKIKAEKVECHPARPSEAERRREDARSMTRVEVQSGKHLANLINECANENLDLSPLTGIPGTVGGAIYGNAGQGFGGKWIGKYVNYVDVIIDGRLPPRRMSKEDCEFGYRTSAFKRMNAPIIWEVELTIPRGNKDEIQAEIDRLLQKRIETQPHVKTAGSIFLSKSKEAPAWKLIDAKGLRGTKIGGIEVSEKHANFLINDGSATFADAKKMVENIKDSVGAKHASPLQIEMRFVEEDGTLTY